MLKQVMLLAYNFNRSNIIESIWAEDLMMAKHLRGKFDYYAGMHSSNVELFMRFVSELSDDKVKDIEDYIEKNPI